jgi:putative ABC transport system permease protein
VSAPDRLGAPPPRLARALATLRVPVEHREFLLGDLDEDFQEIAATRGAGGARRWYWRQAMRILLTRHPESDVVPSKRGAIVTHFMQDVRFALRMLRRAPGFAFTAMITLALGVGATTAIFSVVDAVLLAPLPFTDADRLVIARGGPSLQESAPVSYPTFLEWRESAVFQHTGAYFNWSSTMSGDGDPEQLQGLRTSASLFDALGVRPIVGAMFSAADERRTAETKVLIGEGLWRRRFGGGRDVVGRRIVLNAASFTIIGVLPESFRMRPADDPPDIVAPLRLTPQTAPASLNFISVAGRLKAGQTPERARDELQALVRRLHPEVRPVPTVTVVPVRTVVAGDSARVLWPLLGAVGFLLCIGCANLANLLLARATSRRQEIGIRLALGASRSRIVRQLLTESVVLAVAGGVCGVALAWMAVVLAGDSHPVREAGAYDVRVNLPVLGFALAISLVSGIFFGLAPAVSSGHQVAGTSATRIATGRSALRSALVVVEVALTLVLLVGAGLLVRSFANLMLVDKGFDAARVVRFGLSTPGAKYATPEARLQFFQTALAGLAALPTVRAVGLVNELPLGGGGVNGGVPIQGRTFAPGQLPMPEKRIVSPDYFKALGIPILRGRGFSEHDRIGTTPVMVISESFARRHFDGVDPIGQRAAFNWDMEGFQEIVGVVADVKHYGLDDGPQQMVYVSHLQRELDAGDVVVSTTGEVQPLFTAARDVIRRLDPDRPLTSLGTLDDVVARSVATRRFALWMVGGFAAIGLVLASTGIYGVVAYAARQRTREFGIRLALGARSGEVIRLVLRQGLIPVVVGVVLGTAGALALTGLIRAQLFGVEPTDPATFSLVVLVLGLVGVAACYLPARRANRLNPSAVLRAD